MSQKTTFGVPNKTFQLAFQFVFNNKLIPLCLECTTSVIVIAI